MQRRTAACMLPGFDSEEKRCCRMRLLKLDNWYFLSYISDRWDLFDFITVPCKDNWISVLHRHTGSRGLDWSQSPWCLHSSEGLPKVSPIIMALHLLPPLNLRLVTFLWNVLFLFHRALYIYSKSVINTPSFAQTALGRCRLEFRKAHRRNLGLSTSISPKAWKSLWYALHDQYMPPSSLMNHGQAQEKQVQRSFQFSNSASVTT